MFIATLVAICATLFAPGAASAVRAAQAPATVRLEVLSLLVPQRVVVSSPDGVVELPRGGRLLPGAPLIVERDGRSLIARAGGWRWRGDRLVVGGSYRRLAADVRGRDNRTRSFRGPLTITSNGRALEIVVEVEFEDLVASAVAAELDRVTERPALEAAAVAIRSYLLANRGRHAAEGFDFCDTTHCVFSRGIPGSEDAAAVGAASATRGLVLEREGRVVSGYVTACCGGRTTTPADVWGAPDTGDFEGVICTYCSSSRYYEWRRSASVGAVADAVSTIAGRRLGPDTDFVAIAGAGGWTRWVVMRSGGRETRVGGDAFRMAVERRLGWDAIPSPRFTIERVRGSYRFAGGGYGHGIGLCIAGAIERGRRGASRDEILAAYFPTARVELLQTIH